MKAHDDGVVWRVRRTPRRMPDLIDRAIVWTVGLILEAVGFVRKQ